MSDIDSGVASVSAGGTGLASEVNQEIIISLLDNYAVRVAVNSGDANITYIGQAAPGSATSSAVWQIKEVDETTGTVITWADGDVDFDNIWDNRESLSYS